MSDLTDLLRDGGVELDCVTSDLIHDLEQLQGNAEPIKRLRQSLFDHPGEWECTVGHPVDVAIYVMHQLRERVEQLTAITASLPHDALGNAFMPPVDMWGVDAKPFRVEYVERDGERWTATQLDVETSGCEVCLCKELYPTREAAETARKETADV